MKKVEMLTRLNAALSSAPFEGDVPKCFAERTVAEGENPLGSLTDHPEIIRLFTLRDRLYEEANEILKGLKPGELQRQSVKNPAEWQREVTYLKSFAESIGDLAWAMTRNALSASLPVIGIRAGWQIVEMMSDDEEEGPTNPFAGGGVMHVVMIGR